MKQIIVGIVVLVVVLGAGWLGYMYFQGELDTLATEKQALEAQLLASDTNILELKKAQDDAAAQQTQELGNIATFVALDDLVMKLRETKVPLNTSTSTGSTTGTGETDTTSPAVGTGTITEAPQDEAEMSNEQIMDEATLDIFYSPAVRVEGPIVAPSYATYKIALQKQLAEEDKQNEVIWYPIELSQGEWTAVVSLKDVYTDLPMKLEVSATGSVVPSALPARKIKTQKMYMTLAKWEDGVISEQYTFDYAADVAKSKLLQYVK